MKSVPRADRIAERVNETDAAGWRSPADCASLPLQKPHVCFRDCVLAIMWVPLE